MEITDDKSANTSSDKHNALGDKSANVPVDKYKVLVDKFEIMIDAENVEIQTGTLIFYFDKAKTKVKALIPAGQWATFEILEEEYALQVQSKSQDQASKEAVHTYKNQGGKFVEEEKKKESQEAVLESNLDCGGVCV